MVKYPVSDKVSSFGIKPHIKKGYYPGQLLKVELFANADGTARVGKYGQQLIFSFAIFKPDPETDAPTVPMRFCGDKKLKLESDVVISKFVYHRYKASKKGEQWTEGEYQTAITPNSAITGVLKSLGWEFSTEDVDPEDFVGNWVELNIDDYEQGEGDEAYTASTIKDVNPYEGPEVKGVKEVKVPESPKKVEKQVKHEAVEKTPEEDGSEMTKLISKKGELEKMHKDGFLTKDGLRQLLEQIDTKIGALEKK